MSDAKATYVDVVAEYEAMRAESELLMTDIHEYHARQVRQSELLHATANALHGGAMPDGYWSWHDLPQLAAAMRGLLRKARERAEQDLMAVGHALEAETRTDAMDDCREWIARIDAALTGAAVQPSDVQRLDWLEAVDGRFHNIDRISSVVGQGFNGKPSLREAIDAAMTTVPTDAVP